MCSNQCLDQSLVSARLRRRHRRPLRHHDQLPAAATLQPDRDADGQGVDLRTRAPGHYSAASSTASDAAKAGDPLVRQLGDEAADSGGMQRDRDPIGRDIDTLDQQPQDARLFSG
jgi:hypothetical protein